MSRTHRILWGEGIFLHPQHFQQYDLFWEQRLSHVLQTQNSYHWGVTQVELDSESLQTGGLQANHLEVVFQDGACFESPRLEPIPLQRNLNDIPQAGLETTIYACLPVLNAFGGNVRVSEQAAGNVGKPVRYISECVQVPDLYTTALESEISVLRANVSLMVEGENRDGYHSVPIARVAKNATGGWRLEDAFIPPLRFVGASRYLTGLVKRLLDILELKSRTLTAAHRERAKNVVEFGTSDITSFWLLHTANRAFPLLQHLFLDPKIHPAVLYQQLAQLSGELLTFSSGQTLQAIPPYQHEDLTGTFQRLESLIRELLETVISTHHVVIPLVSTRPSMWLGRIESDNLLTNADFYLSVSSDAPATQVLEAIPVKLKVGSPDDVEKILNSALSGVRLTHVGQTPPGIPVRIGNHYFALEPQGSIFERMLQSRSICIYTPKTLPDVQMELYAVIR